MKSLLFLILPLALLPCIGCKDESGAPVPAKTSDAVEVDKPKIEYQIGDYDTQGRLVVFAIADKYRVLETEVALVFSNVGTETEPKASFDLITKAGHHRHSTLNELMNDLRSQNVSKAIGFYGGTCGGPVWYGLPEDVVNQFFDAMKNEGYELRTESPDGIINSICTCTN
jgi:hypothetical protein